MNYTKEQQKEYLEVLGYTIEEYVVIQHHSKTRADCEYDTKHPITLAYKERPDLNNIEAWNLNNYSHNIKNVFEREFYDRLYNSMLIQAKQATLKETFQ